MPKSDGPIEDVLITTPLQRGLHALHYLGDDTDPYHIQFTFRLDGELNEGMLKDCAGEVLKRHPNLRAAFRDTGLPHPVQIIARNAVADWRVMDLSGTGPLDAKEADYRAAAIASEEFHRPFDLAAPAPLRLRLLRWSRTRRHLIFTAHHIIIDGWSAPLFFRELMDLYAARLDPERDPVPEAPVYRRYISWLRGKPITDSLPAWRAHLGETPSPCLLAPDAGPTPSARPLLTDANLSRKETDRLATWCRHNGVTVSNAVLWTWGLILGALLGRTEIVTGTVVSGRPPEVSGIERMIGLFINTVPVRIRFRPDTDPASQIRSLRDQLASLRNHEHVGVAEIQRNLGVGPLFDTLVVHQNTPGGTGADSASLHAGVLVTPLASTDSTHYPLTVVPAVVSGRLTVRTEARADLGNTTAPVAVDDAAEAITQVLRMIPYSDGSPAAALGTGFPPIVGPPRPSFNPPDSPVHAIYRVHVEDDPEEVSVIDACGSATRGAVWEGAGTTGGLLRRAGVRQGDRVGLVLTRTTHSPMALLACSRIGAIAVQATSDAPSTWTAELFRRVGVAAIYGPPTAEDIAQELGIPFVPAPVRRPLAAMPPDAGFIDAAVNPGDPLYLIFTSGSSGAPKAVLVPHRAVVALAEAHRSLLLDPLREKIGRSPRVGHAWSFAFDASWQPLAAWLAGHQVRILDDGERIDPERYVTALADTGVDAIETSPTMLAQLEGAGLMSPRTNWPGLSLLGLGGEPIDAEVWKRLSRMHRPRALNFYGPTENTVDTTVADLSSHPSPVIGKPLPSTNVQVLDPWLRPCPVGVAGELYLSGHQVAYGYWGRPDLTASSFVAGPGGSTRYRTGDLANRTVDGALRYLGRIDEQIKIRGYRVEPDEVLAGVLKLPGVRDARVGVERSPAGNRLIAAVLLEEHVSSDPPSSSALLSTLRTRTASHLLPARIIPVEDFPLTRNGKLDVHRLPETAQDASGAPPEGEVEEELARRISELTGQPVPDRDADIRDLGLDSILIMQLCAGAGRSNNKINISGLTPRLILANPSIRGMAANLISGVDASTRHGGEEFGVFPATPIQEWLLNIGEARRFCQWAVIGVPDSIGVDELKTRLGRILAAHGMLRATVLPPVGSPKRWRLSVPPVPEGPERTGWIRNHAAECLTILPGHHGSPAPEVVQHLTAPVIEQLDPFRGRMLRAAWFPDGRLSGGTLFLFVHHLAVDATSWRVIIDDLVTGEAIAERTPFRRWAMLLDDMRTTTCAPGRGVAWETDITNRFLGRRAVDPHRDLAVAAITHLEQTSPAATTMLLRLIQDHPGSSPSVRDVLLATLGYAFRRWRGHGDVLIDLEGHGRDDAVLSEYGDDSDDLARTVGWFTTITPIRLPETGDSSTSAEVLQYAQLVANRIAAWPGTAVEHSLLHGISATPAEVEVNYLGRLDLGGSPASSPGWALITSREMLDALPEVPEPQLPRTYALEVTFSITPDPAGPRVTARFNGAAGLFDQQDIQDLGAAWRSVLETAFSSGEHERE